MSEKCRGEVKEVACDKVKCDYNDNSENNEKVLNCNGVLENSMCEMTDMNKDCSASMAPRHNSGENISYDDVVVTYRSDVKYDCDAKAGSSDKSTHTASSEETSTTKDTSDAVSDECIREEVWHSKTESSTSKDKANGSAIEDSQPHTSTTPSKPTPKDAQSDNGNDESFVVQVDDVILKDIDSDLVCSSQSVDSDLVGPSPSVNVVKPPPEAESVSLDSNGAKEQGDNTRGSSAESDVKESVKHLSETDVAVPRDCKDTTKQNGELGNPVSKSDSSPNRSTVSTLWVGILSSVTGPADLKELFSKHGEVTVVRVITKTKGLGSEKYGFVTMATAEASAKCIQNLNRTEFQGRIISVEQTKTEPKNPNPNRKTLSLRHDARPSATQSRKERRPTTRDSDSRAFVNGFSGINKVYVNSDRTDKRRSRDRPRPLLSVAEMHDIDAHSFEKLKRERDQLKLENKDLKRRNQELQHLLSMQTNHNKTGFSGHRLGTGGDPLDIELEKRQLARMRDTLEREKMETERVKLETERLRVEKEREVFIRQQDEIRRDSSSSRPKKRSAERGSREVEWGGGSKSKRPTTSAHHRLSPEPPRVSNPLFGNNNGMVSAMEKSWKPDKLKPRAVFDSGYNGPAGHQRKPTTSNDWSHTTNNAGGRNVTVHTWNGPQNAAGSYSGRGQMPPMSSQDGGLSFQQRPLMASGWEQHSQQQQQHFYNNTNNTSLRPPRISGQQTLQHSTPTLMPTSLTQGFYNKSSGNKRRY